MSDITLRPHHALCIRFFEGRGYSEDFVSHMSELIARLQSDDPMATLTVGCDAVCGGCPHNICGVCESEDKVRAIDIRALDMMELSPGAELSRSELFELAYDKIISPGRLREVCRDCMWIDICDKAK